MEPQSKLLEKIILNPRPKTKQHLSVFMDKYTHEESLSQPLQTNNKQYKVAVTFLTDYNGIFKDINKKK